MSTSYDLIPTSHAYGGETIARLPDGRAVFIPYAIPGEVVRLELVEEKQRFARARLLEVLEPSSERVSPRCPHYGECGGCHYQHLSYPAQLAAKTTILKDQLERIGGLASPEVAGIAPSIFEVAYRNHVQFHLAPDGSLGYHKARTNDVLAIRECHLPELPLQELWPQLEFEPGAGVDRVGLRLGCDGDLQIILESGGLETPELSVEDLPVSVVHLSPGGAITLAGSPTLEMEVLERRFRVSAGSFFQANTVVAAMMALKVREWLGERSALRPDATLLDLYCGVGLFSLFLAESGCRLVGVEASEQAVDDFACNLDEFDGIEIYQGAAEVVLPSLDLRPDAVVVDPPREGLARPVIDSLLRLAAPTLVYVSCDPATLARDAKRLTAGGYVLQKLSLFDQFPQTYHIESISLWGRR